MKQGNFIILYLLIYIFCFVSLYTVQEQYDAVQEEKIQIEICLKNAIEGAAWNLSSVLYETDDVKKSVVEESFFDILTFSMGQTGKSDTELLRLYVPLIIILEEDGAFFYYVKQISNEGKQELFPLWTDKHLFEFPSKCSEALKKAIISEEIEKIATEIISEHNHIAEQYGMKYQFYVPDFWGNTAEKLYFPMCLAVFQGWPMVTEEIFFENCVDAAVYIQEVKKYLVEVPCSLEQTKAYYHDASCMYAGSWGGRLLEEMLTKAEALSKYGALPCGFCQK